MIFPSVLRGMGHPSTFAAMMIIVLISLTIHVVMLQVFHIPYPDMRGVGRVGLLLVTLRVLALMTVARLWGPQLAKSPLFVEIGALALLSLTLAGEIRNAIMGIVTTNSFAFEFIELAGNIVSNLLLAAMIVPVVRRLDSPLALVSASLAIMAMMIFVVDPAIGAMVASYAHLARPEVFTQPYGFYVLGWSYPTFLETVYAVFIVAALAGPRLSSRVSIAFIQFVVLILLLRGTLILQTFFPWFMKAGPWPAALSISQFFLQDLVMAILVWIVWINRFCRSKIVNEVPQKTLSPCAQAQCSVLE